MQFPQCAHVAPNRNPLNARMTFLNLGNEPDMREYGEAAYDPRGGEVVADQGMVPSSAKGSSSPGITYAIVDMGLDSSPVDATLDAE